MVGGAVRRGVRSLAALARSVASGVGLEGLLISVGTALVAVGSSWISPAGPWMVTGSVVLLAGVAVALPPRSGDGPVR